MSPRDLRLSEQRARQVARELLIFRGWDVKAISRNGQLLEENEYKNFQHLQEIFKGKSKTGPGDGKPDFLLVKSAKGLLPLLVLETKASAKQANDAINEACFYGDACFDSGHDVLAVGIAGAEQEICSVIVKKKINGEWKNLTLNNEAIDWIPSPKQTEIILGTKNKLDVKPETPSEEVLYSQANRLNEILRECKIKDEYRPVYVATIMLALWYGDVSIDPAVVLKQINANTESALNKSGKSSLSHSLRIDEENDALAARAWEIIDILKKLNIRSFLQEHDYLGQLYETFFRYTGGNTIGQYFTPRHVIQFIAEVLNIGKDDAILDPACGTGGFLIGALNHVVKESNLPYEEVIDRIKNNLYGIESEPATAALCITNMILRGDGKSGIIKDDCFERENYPEREVDFVLMNPPFPHKKTDTPATHFIDRGLRSLKKRGILASIVPYSLLVNTSDWHKRILKENTLHFIATLPPDLFNPYASYNTAILMIQKGIPHNDKKAFVCRISNDGYKLKKNFRIKQAGSQVDTIKTAFEERRSIPEVCALAEIREDSREWSPEAFIENSPHSDIEFINGLETSIHKQAAFYVAFGNKLVSKEIDLKTDIQSHLFSPISHLSLNDIPMGQMSIEQFFDVELGGKEEIEDLEDGNFPIVSTSEFMNGVTTWKKPSKIYDAPCITVATDGSTCSSFVQEFPFYAFYKVAILKPKNGVIVNTDALYYVAYLLSREKWRYVYARKFGKYRINKTVLFVPVNSKGEPDFDLMGSIIRKTKAYPIISFFRSCALKDVG